MWTQRHQVACDHLGQTTLTLSHSLSLPLSLSLSLSTFCPHTFYVHVPSTLTLFLLLRAGLDVTLHRLKVLSQSQHLSSSVSLPLLPLHSRLLSFSRLSMPFSPDSSLHALPPPLRSTSFTLAPWSIHHSVASVWVRAALTHKPKL